MGTATWGTNAVDWEERIPIRSAPRRASGSAARPSWSVSELRRGAGVRLRQHPLHDRDAHRHLGDGQADPLLAAHPQLRPDHVGLRLGGQASRSSTTRGCTPRRHEMDADPHAPHHGAVEPRLESGARAGISTLRGAFNPDAGIAEEVARKIKRELEKFGSPNEPLGVDVIELPILFALQQAGIEVVDGQQVFLEARKDQDAGRDLAAHPGGVDGGCRLRQALRVPAPGRAGERDGRARRQDAVRPGLRVRRGRQRDLG